MSSVQQAEIVGDHGAEGNGRSSPGAKRDTGVLTPSRLPGPGERQLAGRQWLIVLPGILLSLLVIGTAGYVNTSLAVTNQDDYRFYPPFRAGYDRNMNHHLGAEYFSIARALYSGRGFADPFREQTGPTAWMPPVLPAFLAGLLWLTDGDRESVMVVVIVLQAAGLNAAGWFVLILARRTTDRISRWAVLAAYAVALLSNFTLAFQATHDCWLTLLTLTLIFGWASFRPPLERAFLWGLFGGSSALIGPILGFAWGVLTLAEGLRNRTAGKVLVSAVAALAVVSPWAVRNYLTFGRLIPVKSNVAFELYQSQCLEPDGVLRDARSFFHPYAQNNDERKAYQQLGEMAYLDEKMARWKEAVRHDPWGALGKAGNRFLAATLVYVPLNEVGESYPFGGLWVSRLTHALPFLAALVLLGTAPWCGLRREQQVALILYGAYLAPYVLVSYYARYAFPLLVVQTLLVIWAMDRILTLQGVVFSPGTVPAGFSNGRCQAAAFPAPLHLAPPEGSAVRSRDRQSVRGPQLHRWAAAILACGLVLWCYGADYAKRLMQPRVERFGSSVVVPDFFQEWYSAHLWWSGRSPYGPMEPGAREYLGISREVTQGLPQLNAHPPGAILLALPLGGLDFADAFAVWGTLSAWCLAVSVLLLVRGLRPALPGWAVLLVAVAVALSTPFWAQLVHGQLNLFLLLLIVGAWLADRSERPLLAGGLIGTAVLVKLFPAYLLVYFVLARRWRALAAGLTAIGIGVVVTSAVLGLDTWPVYFTEVVPVTKEFASAWPNASLVGWWLKLFDPSSVWPMVRPTPIVAERSIALAGAALSGLALTGWLWYCIRRTGGDRDVGFAAATVIMLLVSPTTWDHYFLLLALPVTVLGCRLPAGWPRLVLVSALITLAIPLFQILQFGLHLVGVTGDGGTGWTSPPVVTATLLSAHTYALLSLLVLLNRVRVTGADSPAPRAEPVPGASPAVPAVAGRV
jgi:hypothetical protein